MGRSGKTLPSRGERNAASASAEPTRLSAAKISPRTVQIAAQVSGLAAEIGASPSHVALAWLRQQTQFGRVVPILGARTRAQLEDSLRSLELTLDPSHWEHLEAATRVELGFPHAFLQSSGMRSLLSGGAPELPMRA